MCHNPNYNFLVHWLKLLAGIWETQVQFLPSLPEEERGFNKGLSPSLAEGGGNWSRGLKVVWSPKVPPSPLTRFSMGPDPIDMLRGHLLAQAPHANKCLSSPSSWITLVVSGIGVWMPRARQLSAYPKAETQAPSEFSCPTAFSGSFLDLHGI